MLAFFLSLGGLHDLHTSRLVQDVWRASNFMLSSLLLGGFYVFIRTPGQHASRRFLMSALALVTLRSVVTQIERWNEPLLYEGVPVNTVWLSLAAIGFCLWWREQHRNHP